MKTTAQQINSLADAINEALQCHVDGRSYDDSCITFDGEKFEYWNTASAYSHAITAANADIVISPAWDLGGDYKPGDGQVYAESFAAGIIADSEHA